MKGIFFSLFFRFSKALSFIILSNCFIHSVNAQTYYVDATLGNDQGPGSQLQPWKTITKVNSSRFLPGDFILFKCGEVWREQLDIPGSGTSEAPITFTKYGDNCDKSNAPVIDGSDIVSGWVPFGENIFVADAQIWKHTGNLITNSAFNFNYSPWTVWSTNSDATREFLADCNLSGGCLSFTSGLESSDNHIGSNKFSKKKGFIYKVDFSVFADEIVENVRVQVRVAGNPDWSLAGLNESLTASTDIEKYSYTFEATTTAETMLFVYLPLGQKKIYLDDIKVTPVTQEYADVKQVFVDGKYLNRAQHPNTGTGYWLIDEDSIPGVDKFTGADFLKDAQLSQIAEEDLVGAGIQLRTMNWMIEDHTVTGLDLTGEIPTLLLDSTTKYFIRKDIGYYLDNKLWMLDSPGEWFYDSATRKLYVWLENGVDPIAHKVEVSYRDQGVKVMAGKDIFLSGLQIKNIGSEGILLQDSLNCAVQGTVITDSGRVGIHAESSDGTTLTGNVIVNSVNEGVQVGKSDAVIVSGNHIENSGTVGSPKNSLAAIHFTSNSNNAIINNNTVLNSGYIGIRFLRETSINNNVIEKSCMVLDDCGAIYTFTGANDEPLYNSEIIGNIIVDVIGNSDGVQNPSMRAGIYLDNVANGISMQDNTIVNADRGVFFHAAYSNNLQGNTFFGNRISQVYMAEQGLWADPGQMQGNTITDNIFFPLNFAESIELKGLYYNINFGFFDENRYSDFYNDKIIFESYKPNCFVIDCLDKTNAQMAYSLLEWQEARDMDLLSSIINPFPLLPYIIQSIDADTKLINNPYFDEGLTSWNSYPAVIEWQAECGLDGGCLLVNGDNGEKNSANSSMFSIM